MENSVYDNVISFKRKYWFTIARRLKQHSKVVQRHLNPGEKVLYAFAAQKNANSSEIFETCVVALTNERLLIGQDSVIFGYYLSSVTPDLYSDLQVYAKLLWGTVVIDTIKERIVLSNISKRALPEIETRITSYMMEAKKKYKTRDCEKK